MWISAHENVVQSFRRQVIDCISRGCCAASICGTAVLRVGRAAGCDLDVLEVPMEHFKRWTITCSKPRPVVVRSD